MPILKRSVLAASLFLNLMLLGYGAHIIHGRGGWAYVMRSAHASTSNPGYADRTTHFDTLPPPQHRPIVFAGDSLTAHAEWVEVIPGALNRGIGGDTSAGLLRRVNQIAKLQPRILFVLIGTNDSYMLRLEPEDTARNVGQFVDAIRRESPETTVVIQSIPPSRTPKFCAWAKQANVLLLQVAAERDIQYLDLWPTLSRDEMLDPSMTTDGLHLNGRGYATWAQVLRPLIR